MINVYVICVFDYLYLRKFLIETIHWYHSTLSQTTYSIKNDCKVVKALLDIRSIVFKRYSQTLVLPDAVPPATPTIIGFITQHSLIINYY